jgi:hypothetical protein
MASRKNKALPIAQLETARNFLISEIEYLRNLRGTVWCFIGASTMIEYLASLSKGAAAGRTSYIEFIKEFMRDAYKKFSYRSRHRVHRGPKKFTKEDLPEQMYFILRCGLVHGFSLVPTSKEKENGGRERSLTINSRADAVRDNKAHLDNFSSVYAPDSVYFVDEDLLDDLIAATNKLFADPAKQKNISKMLQNRPFIWPL